MDGVGMVRREPEQAARDLHSLGSEVIRLRDALSIIALRSHKVVLAEPIDWRDVANTFVSVARNALDGK